MPTRVLWKATVPLLLIATRFLITAASAELLPPAGTLTLYANPASHSAVALKWTGVEGESQYHIERKRYGVWEEIDAIEGSRTNYLDEQLEPLTVYDYRIRAWNEAGFSEYSNPAAATTLPDPEKLPAAPGIVSFLHEDTWISLQWDYIYDATGYRLEFKTGAAGDWIELTNFPATVTGYTHDDLNPLTEYFYRIRAYNAAGLSEYSFEERVTTYAPPPSPPDLHGTALSYKEIGLHWNDVITNLPPVWGTIGYHLEIQRGSEWEHLSFADIDVTNHLVEALQPSTEYSFRIVAHSPGGPSGWSYFTVKTLEPPPIPPQVAPVLYADTLTATSLRLKWLDVELETEYRIERKNSAGQWEQIATAPANSLSYTNTGLQASTTYAYRVCAANSFGASPSSNEAAAITRLPPSQDVPTLRGAPSSPSAVFLFWNTVPVAEQYRLERKNEAGDWVVIYETTSASSRYTDEGLIPSTPYTYRVGDRTAEGDGWYYSTELTVQIPPELTQPLVVTAKALSSTSIQLAWQPLPFAESYYVAKLIDGGWTHTELPVTATTYLDAGLSPATSYTYILYARNSISRSPETPLITVTTRARDSDPISFQSISHSAAGITLHLAGPLGQKFKIQTTPTFATWTDATGIFILSADKQVTLPRQVGAERLFYRAIRAE